MVVMPLKSTVGIADKRSGSLRAVIPRDVVRELDIRPGDVIAWEIDRRGSKKVAIIRKLE